MKKVLFVCTGNVCRSPMAEGLFRDLAGDKAAVASAGVGAIHGQAPSANASAVMDDLGISIRNLRSQPISQKLVDWADYILVMTYGHLDTMLMLYPSSADKIFLLRAFEPGLEPGHREVADPIGQSIRTYTECRDQIRQALPHFLQAMEEERVENIVSSRASLKIAIGADHGGVELKKDLVLFLKEKNYQIIDVGTHNHESVDYPDFAKAVASKVEKGGADYGILICKTGVGVCMTANKFPGVRAGLVSDVETARLTRQHNDANVLCLAGETNPARAQEIVRAWLTTEFEGGRHARRVTKIESANSTDSPARTGALLRTDPEIAAVLEKELIRQSDGIELIASENFTSPAVMEAQGSCLTNKYAEGYPGKRWYGGCEFVDIAESLAIERAKELFKTEHVNVQPHSGSQANMAVYFSVLKPGDRILTMELSHGGHLTHGHPMNFSGNFFEVKSYGVSESNEMIDYDELEKTAKEFKPKMITAGASAYPRVIDFERMGQIAKAVDAYLFVDIAHIAGLVAAGVHPSPVGHADFVTTTTHKTLRGPRGGLIMCSAKHAKAIDSQVFPGIQGGPLMHVIAAKAVCLGEALKPEFRNYQSQVVRNAKALCEGMKKNGYRIVSGGTDNHLMLVDLQPNNLTGKDAQETLDKAGITVNKNAIPFDKQSPFKAGGIRLGTPAVTTRGMREDEMFDIANWIHDALTHRDDARKLEAIRKDVLELTKRFPLPE